MSQANICPVEILIRHLSGTWTLQIVWELENHGDQQFGDLRRLMPPVSVKVLSERLKLLAELGFISRTENNDSLRTVRYSLTESGHELYALIEPLFVFACQQDISQKQA